MLTLDLTTPADRAWSILCIGAHCDDIEIGCGGTLLRLLDCPTNVACRWLVFSGRPEREQECRASADMFLASAGQRRVDVLKFRDGFMPYNGAEVKDCFERLKLDMSPDIIFTHHLSDRHQDHRLLAELTWNTFRDHLVLEYEIPKYEGDLGQPSVFVPLDESHCRRKIEYLLSCYRTQQDKRWFSDETFRAVLRLRGIEAAASSGYAEAFHGRKLLLGAAVPKFT